MILCADFLLDIFRLGPKYDGQGTENLCSVKWRLGASGPTNNIYHPTRAFAVRTRCTTVARAARVTPSTRYAAKGCGALGQTSGSASETAARPMTPSRTLAPATRCHPRMIFGRYPKASAKSWNAVAEKTIDAALRATCASAVVGAVVEAVAWREPRLLRQGLAILTPATGILGATVATHVRATSARAVNPKEVHA